MTSSSAGFQHASTYLELPPNPFSVSASTTITLAPSSAAREAAHRPDVPVPQTTTSASYASAGCDMPIWPSPISSSAVAAAADLTAITEPARVVAAISSRRVVPFMESIMAYSLSDLRDQGHKTPLRPIRNQSNLEGLPCCGTPHTEDGRSHASCGSHRNLHHRDGCHADCKGPPCCTQ